MRTLAEKNENAAALVDQCTLSPNSQIVKNATKQAVRPTPLMGEHLTRMHTHWMGVHVRYRWMEEQCDSWSGIAGL